MLSPEHQPVAGSLRRQPVPAASPVEVQFHLETPRSPEPPEQQRIRSAFLPDEDLKPAAGKLRQQPKQVQKVALAGAVRADKHVDAAQLELVQYANGLEASNAQSFQRCHAPVASATRSPSC